MTETPLRPAAKMTRATCKAAPTFTQLQEAMHIVHQRIDDPALADVRDIAIAAMRHQMGVLYPSDIGPPEPFGPCHLIDADPYGLNEKPMGAA